MKVFVVMAQDGVCRTRHSPREVFSTREAACRYVELHNELWSNVTYEIKEFELDGFPIGEAKLGWRAYRHACGQAEERPHILLPDTKSEAHRRRANVWAYGYHEDKEKAKKIAAKLVEEELAKEPMEQE